ncbi:hypothetical protein C4544_04260 [candidate division WS5 bacterium]|uniref:asparagine synthase (glutamine-hydrolyzing) n=1 Tax=candidate division WS5 bacterium TaxID=2093353 RepID=A0A419DCU8_9BACT|nr:MAG: hypothetical protein C4544_04260 [candidate division WS5 bacterium]
MPGISFLYSFKEGINEIEDNIFRALANTLHDERYKQSVLVKDKLIFLGSSSYDGYPMTTFENDDFIVILEGMIYQERSKTLHEELSELSQMIAGNSINKQNKITEWLLNTDGDFIVLVIDKRTGKIYFINDTLGRLPVYTFKSNNEYVISRDTRFILDLSGLVKFDKMALAQTLLFGYALGTRTLFDNVHRIQPSSLIIIDTRKCEIRTEILHIFNFEIKNNRDIEIDQNVAELVQRFRYACNKRAGIFQNKKNILSLSGGLDSRSVAAGLYKESCNFTSVTRLSFDRSESADTKLAKQLAATYKTECREIYSDTLKGHDLLTLLRIKNGLNFLGMSNLIPYFQKVSELYGPNINFFTGDGGDKVFPDLRPYKKLRNIDELVSYIVSSQQRISIDQVAELTQINQNEIIKELKDNFLSYPETDYDYKFIHFIVYERGFKWLFEGEDRNRFYFWSVSPFYSLPFLNYAMNCPDTQKANYRLYRKFLLTLAPETANIKNKDWNLTIVSKKLELHFFVQSLISRIPRNIKNILKKKMDESQRAYSPNSVIMTCLRNQISSCNKIYDYLSEKAIKGSIDTFNKNQIDILFTIVSIIEDLECEQSELENYSEYDV